MKIAQAVLLISATALSALAFSGSAATAGPIVPRGHYCLAYNLGGTDCSFASYKQCLETALACSATARPLAMTKMIEPVSSVGNGLELIGQAPFETTPASHWRKANVRARAKRKTSARLDHRASMTSCQGTRTTPRR
jgi:hypothetical protein